jgi:hypothetical protein
MKLAEHPPAPGTVSIPCTSSILSKSARVWIQTTRPPFVWVDPPNSHLHQIPNPDPHKLRTNHTVRSSDRLSPLSRWNCDMNCKPKRRCRITWTRQDAVEGPEEPRSHWQGSKAHHPPFGSNKDLLRNPSHQQGEQSSVYVLVNHP